VPIRSMSGEPPDSVLDGTVSSAANAVARRPSLLAVAVDQIVVHPRFGRGVVRAVDSLGTRATATIAFEQGGTKRIVVAHARLQPAPPSVDIGGGTVGSSPTTITPSVSDWCVRIVTRSLPLHPPLGPGVRVRSGRVVRPPRPGVPDSTLRRRSGTPPRLVGDLQGVEPVPCHTFRAGFGAR